MRNRQRTFQKITGMGRGQFFGKRGFGRGRGVCKFWKGVVFDTDNYKQVLNNYKEYLESELKDTNLELNKLDKK